MMGCNRGCCADGFEFARENGDAVRGAFTIDAHWREAIAWRAVVNAGISGLDARDMMLAAVEKLFSAGPARVAAYCQKGYISVIVGVCPYSFNDYASRRRPGQSVKDARAFFIPPTALECGSQAAFPRRDCTRAALAKPGPGVCGVGYRTRRARASTAVQPASAPRGQFNGACQATRDAAGARTEVDFFVSRRIQVTRLVYHGTSRRAPNAAAERSGCNTRSSASLA